MQRFIAGNFVKPFLFYKKNTMKKIYIEKLYFVWNEDSIALFHWWENKKLIEEIASAYWGKLEVIDCDNWTTLAVISRVDKITITPLQIIIPFI